MIKRILFAVLIVSLAVTGVFANGGAEDEAGKRELVINSNQSDPAPKAALAEVVEGFKAANPDIEVTLNSFDHEAYKTAIRNFLATDPPDVCLWFAGNRMKFFVDEGLFADISDVWSEYDLNDSMSATKSALSVDGKQYGVPWGYYQWGMFYRTDIFDQYGIDEPTSWDEFIAAGETLKANDITPVAIGTKYLWTAGGWFDYLNLRVNGLDYHMDLMLGKASYLDPELDEVFDVWGDLIDRGFFLENHATYSWQEAQAPLINGQAAMYLIGNFIMPDMEAAGIGDNMGFFQFPQINPAIGMYEDAPMDTYHIPAGAENMEEAKLFLAYIASPEIQAQFAYATGNIPPNKYAAAPTIPLTKEGFEMLGAADGLAQFYDRDTNPELASAGMQGFQEFMVYPDREDAIREKIEVERINVYGE
jgi:multiple sugar transport system substrate-binding protein